MASKPNPDLNLIFANADKWVDAADVLRILLLDCGLTETKKWNQACYLQGNKNIAIIQRMNDFLALMFFKGALVPDPDGLLRPQGPNSHSALRLEFQSADQINAQSKAIRQLIVGAIEVETAGLRVTRTHTLDLPEELVDAFDEDPDFCAAFEALTPGRQRGYCLHFNAARQSRTRKARIERNRQRILDGKGWNER